MPDPEVTCADFRCCQGHRKASLAEPSSSCPHVYLHKIQTARLSVATLVKMDGFGSDFPAGGSGGKVDAGTIMEQVKVQIAVANAQELLQRMTDKCFKKCIGKPGSTLDNSEQKCIAMCMDRYMDAWNTVSRTYNSRLQRERARM
ncbi:mitochondrial import inner membrane translocase subunit Tim13 [Spinachia spinachia]